MNENENTGSRESTPARATIKSEEERLLERYGGHLAGSELNEAAQKELLLALGQIMRAFVELGFSLKSGENCRVSSIKQSTRGDGLSSQETRCREYAKYKGYEVARVFSDDMSGRLTTRLGMKAMLVPAPAPPRRPGRHHR